MSNQMKTEKYWAEKMLAEGKEPQWVNWVLSIGFDWDEDDPEIPDCLYLCQHDRCGSFNCGLDTVPHTEEEGECDRCAKYDPVPLDGMVGEQFEAERQDNQFVESMNSYSFKRKYLNEPGELPSPVFDSMYKRAQAARNKHAADVVKYCMTSTYNFKNKKGY